jgi:hypothetical protein
VLLLLLLYVSFECVCVYLIERVCRARAENSEVVRWDRILLPKKGEGKPLLFFCRKENRRQSGFSRIEREKREKRVRYKKMITMMMKMKAKEERSKRRRK